MTNCSLHMPLRCRVIPSAKCFVLRPWLPWNQDLAISNSDIISGSSRLNQSSGLSVCRSKRLEVRIPGLGDRRQQLVTTPGLPWPNTVLRHSKFLSPGRWYVWGQPKERNSTPWCDNGTNLFENSLNDHKNRLPYVISMIYWKCSYETDWLLELTVLICNIASLT